MKANTSVDQANVKSDLTRKIRKRMIQVVVQFLILAVILFISSGRLDWVWAWVYLGMNVGILAINLLVVSPELMAERSEIKENVKGWDKVLSTLISVLTLGAFVVTGLDKRFGWSPQLSDSSHCLDFLDAGASVVQLGDGVEQVLLRRCPHPDGPGPYRRH